MIKFWVAFILLSLTAFAQTGDPSCQVAKGSYNSKDTVATILVGPKKVVMSCVSVGLMTELAIADSAYPACREQKLKDDTTITVMAKRDSLTNLAYLTTREASANWKKSDSLSRIALLKSDTISYALDTIVTLTEGKLKRCEDDTPTFMERLYQVGGAFIGGILIGAILTK